MKCIICFMSETGIWPNDFFVATQNDHKFHYRCAQLMIANGTPQCPLCDEDLRGHPFVRVNSQGSPVPPKPTLSPGTSVAAPAISAPSRPVAANEGTSGLRQVNRAPKMPTPSAPVCIPSKTVTFQVTPDHTFKIVVLGDASVGKSSLIHRYADDKYDPFVISTTGCDLRVKSIELAGQIVRLNIWDTAGEERHRSLTDMYLRRADGIIFCFDVTRESSFRSLHSWFEFSLRTLSPDTVKILVGNKSDLWDNCVVHPARVEALAQLWNAQYLFASAKDAINVEAIFRSLGALILEKRLPSTLRPLPTPTPPAAPSSHNGRQHRQSPVNPHYLDTGEHGHVFRLSGPSPRKDKKRSKSTDCC